MSAGEERELKFATVDHGALRDCLRELRAERSGPETFEDNLILDRGGELSERGCLLRVRIDQRGARLTFKGPARYEGGTKVRREAEAAVEGVAGALAVLEGLGYRVVRRYQKRREEWRLAGVTVALDRTPIGDFAEFEGDGAEEASRRCGFDPEAAERRTYLQLYDDFRRQHPEAPPEMVFP